MHSKQHSKDAANVNHGTLHTNSSSIRIQDGNVLHNETLNHYHVPSIVQYTVGLSTAVSTSKTSQ